MDVKPTATTRSRRRKILCIVLPLVIVIVLALALGLGLGLGLNSGGDDDNDNNNNNPGGTPLPSPNTTLPWTPSVASTWQIILSHPPDMSSNSALTPNVSVYDIDLFDTPKSTIDALRAQGIRVLCYFSAGSYENWRTDAKDFKDADLGKPLDGWPGEKWIDLKSENVRNIMKTRVQLAKDKGCDGVDPDNVDGYQNDNGLGLTSADSIAFMQYLSNITAPLGLALGLKNAGDIVPTVLPIVHFSVNEECVKYSECAKFSPFIDAGKPVFHIEYPDGAGAQQGLRENILTDYCAKSGKGEGSQRFSTVLKKMELDGWVEYCDGSVNVTDINEAVGGGRNNSSN
ncbi:glycoside hydrolase family 114 protein [Bipolaris victoriae FI3]|uniref:alpha-galactosidase n=1 Tax=Bipolaris victoriae (strain FI3) TaxID=930091 RepID=W7EC78_BIPV3|nr:glycoside hydrolase family 114 protein [Bipolaris victoriae FI3]